jgi:hypothetical protein
LTFLDASILLAAEDLDDAHHDASMALLKTGALSTLDLAIYEITNVAELRWRVARRACACVSACGPSQSWGFSSGSTNRSPIAPPSSSDSTTSARMTPPTLPALSGLASLWPAVTSAI